MRRRRDGETARRQDESEVGGRRSDEGATAAPPARPAVDKEIIVEIHPEPTVAEQEAIFAALDLMIETMPWSGAAPRQCAWALAGRREAMRGRTGGSRAGWGRALDRVAGS